VLDKIINDTNNAYQIQATYDDVYLSFGHSFADIETFLRSATLVIERVSDTSKSNDMQQGLSVCTRHTSFIDLMGWTLLFCVFSTTHSNTEKCCFTHIEPDPLVRAPCLLLSISSAIPHLHRHGLNSLGKKSWKLAAKNTIFSLSLYIWRALLGAHLLSTITLLVFYVSCRFSYIS
jgi:lysylphosphatidylglycerol synthetase-like protein (DUF2156 family)